MPLILGRRIFSGLSHRFDQNRALFIFLRIAGNSPAKLSAFAAVEEPPRVANGDDHFASGARHLHRRNMHSESVRFQSVAQREAGQEICPKGRHGRPEAPGYLPKVLSAHTHQGAKLWSNRSCLPPGQKKARQTAARYSAALKPRFQNRCLAWQPPKASSAEAVSFLSR